MNFTGLPSGWEDLEVLELNFHRLTGVDPYHMGMVMGVIMILTGAVFIIL